MKQKIAISTLSHCYKAPKFLAAFFAARKTLFGLVFLKEALFWNVLIFGFPIWILFVYGYSTSFQFNRENWAIFSSVLIASLWIILGPILVMAWEIRYIRLLDDADAHFGEGQVYREIKHKIVNRLRFLQISIGLVFAIFCIWLFVFSRPLIYEFVKIEEYSVIYWITAMAFIPAGYSTGLGIAGVVHTNWLISTLAANVDLNWRPYHEDQRGGLSFLSEFSLISACLFSCGSINIPAALTIGGIMGPPHNIAILSAVVVYGFLILLIFFWPMSAVTLCAVKKKREFLSSISSRIAEQIDVVRTGAKDALHKGTANDSMPLNDLIFLYEKIGERSVVPFSTKSGAQVASVGLFPLILTVAQPLFEYWLSNGT